MSEDKRVRRTKYEIENALLRLMEKNKYQKITICQILNESGYSRTAFYAHYRDKDDCLKSFLNNQIAMYVSNFRQIFKAYQSEEPADEYIFFYKYYEHIFEHIYKRKIFYSVILRNDSLNGIKKYFYDLLLKEISKNILVKNLDIDRELYIYSATYALFGCIEYWAKEDFKFTPEHIAIQYYQMRDRNRSNIFVSPLNAESPSCPLPTLR
jgi:AcrR family transcriptional regulator